MTASKQIGTNETYLDPQQARSQEKFAQPLTRECTRTRRPPRFGVNEWALKRELERRLAVDHAERRHRPIEGGVQARDVYLVMTSPGTSRAAAACCSAASRSPPPIAAATSVPAATSR